MLERESLDGLSTSSSVPSSPFAFFQDPLDLQPLPPPPPSPPLSPHVLEWKEKCLRESVPKHLG